MKKSTIKKIISNYSKGRKTYMGNFVYSIQWHPMTGKNYIVRCRKQDEGKEWLDWNGNIINGWEWLKIIDF